MARSATNKKKTEAIGIFILPPSIATLEKRLKKRALDKPEIIAQRVLTAKQEIIHSIEFEYVIINDKFSVALLELIAIVHSTRCRFQQQAVRNIYLFKKFGIQVNV